MNGVTSCFLDLSQIVWIESRDGFPENTICKETSFFQKGQCPDFSNRRLSAWKCWSWAAGSGNISGIQWEVSASIATAPFMSGSGLDVLKAQ